MFAYITFYYLSRRCYLYYRIWKGGRRRRNRFEISHVTPGQRQEFRCRHTLELGFISQWLLIIHIFVHLSLFLISVQEVFDPFYKLPYKLDQDFCDTRHLLFTFLCHENYSLFQSDNGHFISRLVILF